MNIMQYKGFQARIMKAQRLIGSGVHGLPPGRPVDVYSVDAFEEPLSHWIKGAGNYVVPVDSDWGLWFDFTLNDQMNTAVLLSIKGMNPVTGQRTNGFGLERYEEKCPVHGETFKDGLFCEKCNYKWPDQNYIAYPNTLWWDGFRSSDGKVRQFFFTEDLAKSIPELVIGKEDTVPAFGFAFFSPKVRRETKNVNFRTALLEGFTNSSSGWSGEIYLAGDIGVGFEDKSVKHTYYSSPIVSESQNQTINYCSTVGTKSLGCGQSMNVDKAASGIISAPRLAASMHKKRATQEVGVGAGAEISQSLSVDTLKVSDWENEPASVMRLYFVFVEQFEEIKSKGMKDLVGEKEGFLANLPIG